MAAVKSLLEHVEVIVKGKSFDEIVRSSYSCQVECSANAAQGALELVKELLSNDGIPIASLKKSEVEAFIRDAPKADAETLTMAEYQTLIETLTKYAALKARHNPGKRWSLSLGLSAAGAMALTAAVFTPAGLVLIAAPAGAAIGAVAAAAEGSKARRRDRRTAKQGSISAQEPTAAPAAMVPELALADADAILTAEPATAAVSTEDIAPAGEAEDSPAAAAAAAAATDAPPAAAAESAVCAAVVSPPEVPAPAAPIPAPVPSSGDSSPRGSSDGLVSAVVDLTPTAAAAVDLDAFKPAADGKAAAPTIDVQTVTDDYVSGVPEPMKCDSPFSAAARDTSTTVYGELPSAPPAVRTSFGSDLASSTAGLPPMPKKSKSLTKSMSKKLKKAFSVKDKDSSSKDKDAGAHKALDADSDSPLAPPVPPRRSTTFFRRSSDSTGGSFFRRSSSDLGEVEGVEGSKGSATIKKMVDGIRRSFSLDRPSLDLVAPKKARKAV